MISIIIPNYNYASYIAEALDSVLAQSYTPIEVIVIDNASTDDSDKVISYYADRITYCKQEYNIGASAARNLGVEMAQGDYVAFLDADDIWSADKLMLQYQAMNSHSSPDMTFGYIQNFYSPELDASIKKRLFCSPQPMQGYVPTTCMVRKECFLNVGFFDVELKAGEFIDWYVKAEHLGLRSHIVPEVIALRRIHHGHLGKSIHYQEYCQILKRKMRLKTGNMEVFSHVE